jgi:hypothetical protein
VIYNFVVALKLIRLPAKDIIFYVRKALYAFN